jgi:hypothetical protein
VEEEIASIGMGSTGRFSLGNGDVVFALLLLRFLRDDHHREASRCRQCWHRDATLVSVLFFLPFS